MSLRSAYDRHIATLCKDVEAFPWTNKDAYAGWLLNTWEYVRHTTRLTALAAARLPVTASGLHKRLLQHAAEEMEHEKLLENDLRALGKSVDPERVLAVSTAFAQCLYYQIEYLSPFALFGRVLPLEGVSASMSRHVRERVIHAHGTGTTSFLEVHGDADPEHIEEAFDALANVAPAESAIIVQGMQVTTSLYQRMLSEIMTGLKGS